MKKRCQYSSPIDEWLCPEEAITDTGWCIFHDPDLHKDMSLLKARFEMRLGGKTVDQLRFDGAIFSDAVSFDRAFNQSISFYDAQFHGNKIKFDGAEFHGQKTCFRKSKFYCNEASFVRGKFYSQATVFMQAEFHGQNTTFSEAEFHGGQIAFIAAIFKSQKTSFLLSEFSSDETLFFQTEFRSQEVSFSNAIFTRGQTIFKSAVPKQVFLEGISDFSRISVGKDGRLIFDSVDLARTQFLNADLSKVDFLDVTWDTDQDWKIICIPWGRWRYRCYDEALWRKERKNPQNIWIADIKYLYQLARFYRSLKAYYKKTGEHYLVGHFHYGLMEVQRYLKPVSDIEIKVPDRKFGEDSYTDLDRKPTKNVKKITWWLKHKCKTTVMRMKKYICWEGLYWFSSGYGEDYAWAAIVVFTLLLVFAGVYWLLGVPQEVNSVPLLKQWGHSLLYSFQAGTLGRISFYDIPKSLIARYLHLFESILIPVQFGFFALCLHNRFRR